MFAFADVVDDQDASGDGSVVVVKKRRLHMRAVPCSRGESALGLIPPPIPISEIIRQIIPPVFGSENLDDQQNGRPSKTAAPPADREESDATTVSAAYELLLRTKCASTADWLLQHRLQGFCREGASEVEEGELRRLAELVVQHSSLCGLSQGDLVHVLSLLNLQGTVVESEAILAALSTQ